MSSAAVCPTPMVFLALCYVCSLITPGVKIMTGYAGGAEDSCCDNCGRRADTALCKDLNHQEVLDGRA